MDTIRRRDALALLGVGSVAGCLGRRSSLSSGPEGEAPGTIPVSDRKTPAVWPTANGSAARTGHADRRLRDGPRFSVVGDAKHRLLGLGWVVATDRHVFWMQQKSTTLRRTRVDTVDTIERSFDRVTRVSPVVAGGFLAVHTNAGVEWLDPTTLEARGTTPTASPHVGILADDRRVYVTGVGGSLHAYGAGTGEHAWRVPVDRLATGLASAGRTVYVVDANADGGVVLAVDRRDGTVVWQSEAVGETYTNPVVGSNLYVSGNDGTVYALDRENGETVWTYQMETRGPIPSPSFREGTVFVSDRATGEVVALDADTGARVWRASVRRLGDERETSGRLSSPVTTPSSVLVGASRGGVTALRRDTGEVSWGLTDVSIDSNLAVTGGAVYAVGSEGLVEILG